MRTYLKSFGFSAVSSLAVVVAVLIYLGFGSLLPLIILSIIEITFSFDNAVVNAKVLKKMSPLWQRLFLSVGIIVAIFGMRLVFPILLVALTAKLSWHKVVDLALNHPHQYAHYLEVAHPVITAFGGAFLLMLALHFFMSADKQHHWLDKLEKPLQRIGRWWLPSIVSLGVVVVLAVVPANHHGHQTLTAGLVGVATYALLYGLDALMNTRTRSTQKLSTYTGWAAMTMFVYLELLDASFSLDGVLGAFAITSNVILIVAGLGIGAVWVRSLTVFMVRRGTIDAFRYLEHGAHYAITVLAFAMLAAAVYEIPDAIAGVAGLLCIGGAFGASVRANKVDKRNDTDGSHAATS